MEHSVQHVASPGGSRVQPVPASAPILLGRPLALTQLKPTSNALLSLTSRSDVSSTVRSSPPSYPTRTGQTASPSKGGDVVMVGRHTFEVSKVLGRGAFGVVWEGFSPDFQDNIALKVSRPKREEALRLAVLECEVLEELTQALATHAPSSSCRVPKYLAHAAGTSVGTEVKLAMSRLDGRPLDMWLYGLNETQLCEISVEKLLDGPLPAGRQRTQDLEGAAGIASALCSQLAPVFVILQGIAYHRDVSAHNVLVSGTVGSLDFKVIDFGLATRSGHWERNWKSHCLTGDPRYWSPAAWMFFAHGHQYLENHPSGICHQYKERIDHYAFGVLTLEILFALWYGPSQEATQGDVMAAAQAAWRVYWRKAYNLFRRLHGKEAQGCSKLREELAGSKELDEMLAQHAALCAALKAAAKKASQDDADVSLLAVAPVLISAVELIDMKGSMHWSVVQEQTSVPPPLPPLRRAMSEGPLTSAWDPSGDFVDTMHPTTNEFNNRRTPSMPRVSSTAFIGGARSMPPSMALRKPRDLLANH